MELNWIDIASLAELPADDVIGVSTGSRDVALYSVDGEVFATDNMCTHGNARLCDGFLEDGKIECPLHQGQFDVRTGKALCAPLTEDLRTIPVRVMDGRVQIQVED